MADLTPTDDHYWRKTFFSNLRSLPSLDKRKHDLTVEPSAKIDAGAEFWQKRLFEGVPLAQSTDNKLAVLKDGLVIHEIPLDHLGRETVVGRHPLADLQLESHRMGMYHLVLLKQAGRLYVKLLDQDVGILLNRKKLKSKTPIPLWDGAQVDLPGFRLEFSIADAPPPAEGVDFELEELEDIPNFFYTPPAPPASPVLANLVENREEIGLWIEGTTTLKVVDIYEETHDSKTFRMAGEQPLLFSYRPGQFITFILNINGSEVKRSYSMSSSPSRPHLIEVTIKRVPGGLVSNWFCDQVKLGDRLTIKGPSGKFTCFEYPSSKILFIGAGSGITPVISMSRWIDDTGADVDVKLLASFKSPSDIIFRKVFELWSARSRRFEVAITLTSDWQGTDFWTGFRGRITRQMVEQFVPDLHERHVFLCGPEPFADSVRKILDDLGFNPSCLHAESFGSGRSAQGSKGGGRALELKGPTHKVTFVKSGLTVETDENLSLLELAEAHGIEIDYSCRAGSCGACEVKCRGDVKIAKECEIDPKLKMAGFVYTCCTRALADLELEA